MEESEAINKMVVICKITNRIQLTIYKCTEVR